MSLVTSAPTKFIPSARTQKPPPQECKRTPRRDSTGFSRRNTKPRTRKNGQRDDFLDDFKLRGGINRTAPAVGRHLQEVFKKRDAPAHQNHDQSGLSLNFKWPYHAKVMKMFEHVSSTMGSQRDWISSFINARESSVLSKISSHRRLCRFRNGKCSRPEPHPLCLRAAPRPCAPVCPRRRWPPPARPPIR